MRKNLVFLLMVIVGSNTANADCLARQEFGRPKYQINVLDIDDAKKNLQPITITSARQTADCASNQKCFIMPKDVLTLDAANNLSWKRGSVELGPLEMEKKNISTNKPFFLVSKNKTDSKYQFYLILSNQVRCSSVSTDPAIAKEFCNIYAFEAFDADLTDRKSVV